MPHTILYTSIPSELKRQAQHGEYGDHYQRACIDSWREAGFDIVSINSDSEIAVLRDRRLDVQFVSNGTEHHRTSIERFLSLIRASGDDIAGIVNADCFWMRSGAAIDSVLSAAVDSVVILERLNLEPRTMRPTGVYCGGFDAFFFDTRFLRDVNDADNWRIGEPNWDYWFPLVMHMAGAKLKKPDSPILVHLNHETVWASVEYVASAARLWHHLVSTELEEKLPFELAQDIRSFGANGGIESPDIEAFADRISTWLMTSAESWVMCPLGTAGEFVGRMLASVADSKGSLSWRASLGVPSE